MSDFDALCAEYLDGSLDEAGRDIREGAAVAGEALERGANNAAEAIEDGAQAVGDAIDSNIDLGENAENQ